MVAWAVPLKGGRRARPHTVGMGLACRGFPPSSSYRWVSPPGCHFRSDVSAFLLVEFFFFGVGLVHGLVPLFNSMSTPLRKSSY